MAGRKFSDLKTTNKDGMIPAMNELYDKIIILANAINGISAGAADLTPPNNATNLGYTALTSTTLTLTWTASTSTDMGSYDVYRGGLLLGNTATTSFLVSGLNASTSYLFTVKAKDRVGNIANGTSLTITTPANVSATTLQLSGSSSGLVTPSVTVDKVVMEMNVDNAQVSTDYMYYVDFRPTNATYMYGHNTKADETWSGNVSTLVIDGTPYTKNTDVYYIPRGSQTTVEMNLTSALTGAIYFFKKNDGTYSTKVKVTRLRGYNGSTLAFDYVMSTGTANDQSGNAKNPTVTGGTYA
jgi:hypothetical protein